MQWGFDIKHHDISHLGLDYSFLEILGLWSGIEGGLLRPETEKPSFSKVFET